MQLYFRMVAGGLCGGHSGFLRQHVFFAVAGKQHVELILVGMQSGAGLAVLGARVVQVFLRNGVGGPHGSHAVEVDLRVFGQRRRAAHRCARLGDFFHPVAALKPHQRGPLFFKLCGGLITLLGEQVVVQQGKRLTGGHGIALVHQHFGNAPVDAKAQIHLSDIHIAIKHKTVAVVPKPPLPQKTHSQQHGQNRANTKHLTGDSHIPPCVQSPQAVAAPHSFKPGDCAPLRVRIASGGGLVHAEAHT